MFCTKILTLVLVLTVFVPGSSQISVACEYRIEHRFEVVEDPYSCVLTTLNIQNKTSVTSATGKHLNGNTNSDVKAINIYGGICKTIPSGFGSIFPKIEIFTVWNATLKTVSSTDLQELRNLREIWLYANELEYLESNLFQYNPKIEIIVFKRNKIKFVGKNFFEYLPNVQKVFFGYNNCTTVSADAGNIVAIKSELKQNCTVPKAEATGYTQIGMYSNIGIYHQSDVLMKYLI